MRIAVDTGLLFAAAGRSAGLASQVLGLRGQLDAVGTEAAAAGAPDASQAMSACCQDWSATLGVLAERVAGTGTNLGAAGAAYTTTDATAIPAP